MDINNIESNLKYGMELLSKANEFNKIYQDLNLFPVSNFYWLYYKYKNFYINDVAYAEFLKGKYGETILFSPHDFELLVSCVMWLTTANMYYVTQLTRDGGYDLIKKDDKNLLVQCKLCGGSIKIHDVREFYGVVSALNKKGIFITTGSSTKTVDAFCQVAYLNNSERKIIVIDEPKLHLLMLQAMDNFIVLNWNPLSPPNPSSFNLGVAVSTILSNKKKDVSSLFLFE